MTAKAISFQSTRLICPSGCMAIYVSSPFSKNISFRGLVETALSIRHPALTRGAFRDRHGRWVRDAVDAMAPLTNGAKADGEVVWS
jgi:hypothetical protein